MGKYVKKPVVIEAIQFIGSNATEIMDFMNWQNVSQISQSGIVIHTLEGNHKATTGDFIIKGIQGEYYPCKPDIFYQTYERVED